MTPESNLPPAGAPPPAGPSAAETLNVPAILLLVSGAIGVLFRLVSLVGVGAMNSAAMMNDPRFAQFAGMQRAGGMVGNLLGIALSGFAIYGAMQMRQLRNYGVAMAAAIVSIIPCTGCCCISIPVGIWALVLLMKPEVKAQFVG